MIGSIISSATSLLAGGMAANAQDSANTTNRQIAIDNQNFQREMSNTSYQRAVSDMRAAGLNPALAYSQGGASTPSGATTTVNPVTGLSDGINAARANYMAYKTWENENDKVKQDTATSKTQEAMLENSAKNLKAQEEINNTEAQMRKQELDVYKNNPDLMKIKIISDTASKALGPASAVIGAGLAGKALFQRSDKDKKEFEKAGRKGFHKDKKGNFIYKNTGEYLD